LARASVTFTVVIPFSTFEKRTLKRTNAEVGAKTAYIEAGSPWENQYATHLIFNFFGLKFRDERQLDFLHPKLFNKLFQILNLNPFITIEIT